MLIHFGVDSLEPEWSSSVVCVGTFDGIHVGHQALIQETVSLACQREVPSVLLTFDRHPLEILAPQRAPKRLLPLEENMKMAQKLGVAVYVVVCFNQQLASLEAQEFFDYILVQKLKACQLVVGHDFAMGRNRVGDIRWLRERISTRVIHSFELDGQRVSSTLIRQCLAEGQMHRVYEYLGRPYAITGVVVGGQKLGQALGFPTINLARAGDFVLPADGIYAGRCTTSYGVYKAAISVGIRPAIGGQHRVIEAYLLDYPGYSLYGNAVSLEFLEWLREERYFATLEALREQIAQDVIAVRERI